MVGLTLVMLHKSLHVLSVCGASGMDMVGIGWLSFVHTCTMILMVMVPSYTPWYGAVIPPTLCGGDVCVQYSTVLFIIAHRVARAKERAMVMVFLGLVLPNIWLNAR